VLVLKGVPKPLVIDDDVVISAANSLAYEVSLMFEVMNDSLHGTDGHTHGKGNVLLSGLRMATYRNQNVGVIREKCPRR
jgi:hypothetical protein